MLIPPEPTKTPLPLRAAAAELKARFGPAKSGGDRERHLPQELPHALAVLMRSMFNHPELSFNRTVDDPSATATITADEHDSGHHRPEHRNG